MNRVVIQSTDFDVNAEYQRLRTDSQGAGAIVFFVGLVRDLYQNESSGAVQYIELHHYAGMTEQCCEEIIAEAGAQFPFISARVVHRVGKLHADEQIVMVAVASEHRRDAFHAAQYVMDFLKTRATLWKKEVGSRGAQWIGIKQSDLDAAAGWSDAK